MFRQQQPKRTPMQTARPPPLLRKSLSASAFRRPPPPPTTHPARGAWAAATTQRTWASPARPARCAALAATPAASCAFCSRDFPETCTEHDRTRARTSERRGRALRGAVLWGGAMGGRFLDGFKREPKGSSDSGGGPVSISTQAELSSLKRSKGHKADWFGILRFTSGVP